MLHTSIMTDTPMMSQWKTCKTQAKDALLFFRLGDFYEAFGEDAKILSRVIGLTITTMDKTMAMCGFPQHSLEAHLRKLIQDGYKVSQAHFRYLNPFPKNTGELLSKFKKVMIPEINNGQLVHMINAQYKANAQGVNKIQGMPFTSKEIKENVLSNLK